MGPSGSPLLLNRPHDAIGPRSPCWRTLDEPLPCHTTTHWNAASCRRVLPAHNKRINDQSEFHHPTRNFMKNHGRSKNKMHHWLRFSEYNKCMRHGFHMSPGNSRPKYILSNERCGLAGACASACACLSGLSWCRRHRTSGGWVSLVWGGRMGS